MSLHDLSRRSTEPEWMDELDIQDSRLTDALVDLRLINQALGGYSTSFGAFRHYFDRLSKPGSVTVIDLGCGGGDFAESLLLWAHKNYPNLEVRVTGIDNSPATIAWARDSIKKRLPAELAQRVDFQCVDAFSLPFPDGAFDISHASLFTHHFSSDQVVRLIKEMNRVSAQGIIINDLHRHRIAHDSFALLASVFNASKMVRHDGPLSVRRAFKRDELSRIAAAAGISNYSLTWHWAFRWLLSTVDYQNV